MKKLTWWIISLSLILLSLGVYAWGYASSDEQALKMAWIFLDRFGVVLGIAAVIPLLFAVWEYLRSRRRQEVRLAEQRKNPGNEPAVLIVQVEKNIRAVVEGYIKKKDGFADFDFVRRVREVTIDNHLESDDMDKVYVQLVTAYQDIVDMGADRIHLFITAPAPVAMLTGQLLANRVPTTMYHYQPGCGYQEWGILQR